MTNKERIEAYFASLKEKVREQVPQIVAETAVEVFKENILNGSFDGIPFEPLSEKYLEYKKRNKEKILYYNGFLFASIRPSEVSANRVIISAGSSKVPYARIHNEGLTVNTTARVGQYTRNNYRTSKNGKGKATSTVGAHTRKMNYTMPRRRFMGHSSILNERLMTRINLLMKSK